ncbi:hypothetical protein F5X97DRAFT_327052 [Nemania serpens]|nr:hypothetical protein F5X97DRAFT_327052 [Nemania serpens]
MSLKTKFSVVYFSLIVGVVYTLIGLLVTFNVLHDSCEIPRLSWLDPLEHCNVSTVTVKRDAVLMLRNNTEELVTSSAFVIAAKEHSIPLAKVFNRLLVFTALTCAQTSLYVAARALSGLATQLRRSVPVRAVVLSSLAFLWVPFLQLQSYNQSSGSTTSAEKRITNFIDILSQLSSVGVVIV